MASRCIGCRTISHAVSTHRCQRPLPAGPSRRICRLFFSLPSKAPRYSGSANLQRSPAGPAASTGALPARRPTPETATPRPNLDLLAANFTFSSLTLRHAVRVTVVCGLDVSLILLLHINHGYWLLMTSLIVLQPHVSGTLRRGLERIGGTVGGGIVAAILAVLLHYQFAIAAVLFPLSLLAIAVLPLSYAAFAFFLTPAFVLAWLPYSGDWQLALIRILNTFAGAVIAIIAMMFLFPIYERDRAPPFLRASLAADRDYLEQLLAAWRDGSLLAASLASARRRAGLAHNDTDESLQRLLAESWPRRRPFANFATAFVTYLRRFAQSVTALTAHEWRIGLETIRRGPKPARLITETPAMARSSIGSPE